VGITVGAGGSTGEKRPVTRDNNNNDDDDDDDDDNNNNINNNNTENSHIGHCTHISESTTVKVQNIQHEK